MYIEKKHSASCINAESRGEIMHGTIYKPRVLVPYSDDDLAAEIELIGGAPQGVFRMLPKTRTYLLKLHNVPAPVAHILKEHFLSVGADAALSRRVMTDSVVENSDVILMGTRKHFSVACQSLNADDIGGPPLAAEIEAALAVYDAGPLVPPNDRAVHPYLRRVFDSIADRTIIMGILNVTPDSFSDGGSFGNSDEAVERGLRMIEDGADIIDVGGESTRPGSDPVGSDEEIRRVVPVIKGIAEHATVPISIDTYKAATAAAALEAGASIINDVSALAFDPQMRRVAADAGCPVVLMHIKGKPKDMQQDPTYTDLMAEIVNFLRERISDAVEAGIDERMIIVDPGLGFGKTAAHNVTILRRLNELRGLGRPVLVGISRKATIGHLLGNLPPQERIYGTAAAIAISIANGANIVRVHDVKEMSQVAKVADAMGRKT